MKSNQLLIISLLFYISLAACHTINRPKLIGGEPATEGQFKFITTVTEYDWGDYINHCGAAILSKRTLLTSATCLLKIEPNITYEAVMGTLEINDGTSATAPTTYNITEFKPHPDYDSDRFTADLALVTLETDIDFTNPNIAPIVIADKPVQDDEELTTCGFPFYKGVLTWTHMKVFNKEKCEYTTGYPMTEDRLCALGNEGIIMHYGDSGIPLINSDNELVGVLSLTVEDVAGFPVIYTNVQNYKKWIEENVI